MIVKDPAEKVVSLLARLTLMSRLRKMYRGRKSILDTRRRRDRNVIRNVRRGLAGRHVWEPQAGRILAGLQA